MVQRVVGHEFDALALFQGAIDDAHKDDHAEVGVIPAVHEHGFQRRSLVAFQRRRQASDDGFQHVLDTQPGFRGNQAGVRGVDANDVFDLFSHTLRLCGGQVDFVQNRHDLVVGLNRGIDVRERLRLYPLGGVHDQQRALNRAHRAANFIGKVDVAGGVDQVEDIILSVVGPIVDTHRVGFDRNSAFALDIHRVQQLFLHIPIRHRIGGLDQPVSESGFPVVDMGNDREIADFRELCHGKPYGAEFRLGQWAKHSAALC